RARAPWAQLGVATAPESASEGRPRRNTLSDATGAPPPDAPAEGRSRRTTASDVTGGPPPETGSARSGRLTLADDRGGPPPVDLPLELVLGKPPKMTRRAEPLPSPRRPLDLAGASVAEALDRVLGLPTVADKSFLVTIGDRTVGGLISRDSMVGRFQVPVADCALTLAGFETYAGEVMSIGERPPVALLDAAAATRLAIGEAITNLAAAPIGVADRAAGEPLGPGDLSCIKLSCNWMAAAGHPGEDARLYEAVRAAGETSVALGISIPVGKDSMSMRTQWQEGGEKRVIASPVTLVVTAFGPVTDVRKNVTPELRGTGTLLLVDLGGGKNRMGASCLAQVFSQLGDAPPDLDDPARLRAFFSVMQSLVGSKKLLAYHDRSDGGLIVSALEMAWAGGFGLDLDVSKLDADPVRALFSEELGALLEVASADVAAVTAAFASHGIAVHSIGRAAEGNRVVVTHNGTKVIEDSRFTLRGRWSHVTREIARRRDDADCASEEHEARVDRNNVGLTAEVRFDPNQDIAAPFIAKGVRPKVAILREQGVNGQIEMAAAFTRAGFDAIDVHMTDLIEGRQDLADCRGAVACGGFSFGDVLGAGRGWAATFRYNARAQTAIRKFVDRADTFLLGVCNGCQMVADLAPDLVASTRDVWPRFVRNRSERFEARVVLLRIEQSPSLFFKDMQGSRIPIANAHGEGRAEFGGSAQLEALEAKGLVAARFVDGGGNVTDIYPANPNGSPNGIASVTTPDGRVTVIMPHPERVFRTVQMSWHPPDWGEDSPWMRMFRNARVWVG
ncbi:MAG TPA: phosphoribosylformylglycinamidine synthase, partial [Kofleriaceae bacterium]|nr:phosphoribosylformylglycinamidine synthase [Kofleriaceae bacterium]